MNKGVRRIWSCRTSCNTLSNITTRVQCADVIVIPFSAATDLGGSTGLKTVGNIDPGT